MSDSLPPDYGPEPYDAWVLDDLLSGEISWVPDPLRSVAETMDALRAAPALREVAGESAARAEFRALLAGQSEPDWWAEVAGPVAVTAYAGAVPSVGVARSVGAVRAAGVTGSAGVTAGARTLLLPERTPDERPRPPARSHRRPAPRRGPWRAVTVLGIAAAAVVVGVAALAGTFSGAVGHQGPPGHDPGAVNAPSGSSSTDAELQAVEGGAAKESAVHPAAGPSVTPDPTPGSGPKPGPGTVAQPAALCQQYFGFLAHPASWEAESGVFQQLDKLAGSPWKIPGYCYQLGHPSSSAVSSAPASRPSWPVSPVPSAPVPSGPLGKSGPRGYGGGIGTGQHGGSPPGAGQPGTGQHGGSGPFRAGQTGR